MILPGDRLRVQGRWATHEGVAIGPLRTLPGFWVIHNAMATGVQLVPFERFSRGKPVTVAFRPHPRAVPGLIQRAFSILGKPYKLLDWNCQDAMEWVFSGKAESYERDAALGLGLLFLL